MTTLEITFGDDPKGTHSDHRAAVVPVQFVPLVAIENDLSIETARQFEALDKWVTGIEGSVVVPAAITDVALVVWFAFGFGRAVQFHPPRLNVAGITVTINVAGIEVQNLLVACGTANRQRWRRL